MAWFLYIISILWIVVGLGLALKGEKTKEIMKRIYGERIPKPVCIVPIVIGALFIFSLGAVRPSWKWFPLLMGLLAICKGAIFLFSDEEETKAVLSWWYETPPAALRLWGTMAFLFGVSLFWAIIK